MTTRLLEAFTGPIATGIEDLRWHTHMLKDLLPTASSDRVHDLHDEVVTSLTKATAVHQEAVPQFVAPLLHKSSFELEPAEDHEPPGQAVQLVDIDLASRLSTRFEAPIHGAGHPVRESASAAVSGKEANHFGHPALTEAPNLQAEVALGEAKAADGSGSVVADFRALLYEHDPSWAGNGTVGRSAFVTYAFATGPKSDVSAEYQDFENSFEPLSESDRDTAREALAQWAEISGIFFVEAPADKGDITFGLYDFDLHPIYPWAAGTGGLPSVTVTENYAHKSASTISIGVDSSRSSSLFLHEIGHALGFKHPHEGEPVLATELDFRTQTQMSYNRSEGTPNHLGPLDVDAVQYRYGTVDGKHLVQWQWDEASLTLTQIDGDDSDLLIGIDLADVIDGNGGDDTIAGFDGADVLRGGTGKDFLFGGAGKDVMRGQQGKDSLDGGANNDTLTGGKGDDSLEGWAGDDRLQGGQGHDSAFGWNGLDRLFGGLGDDSLAGGPNSDWLEGGDGKDRLTGGSDDDELLGGTGADVLYGAHGLDRVFGGPGGDLLYGSIGDDRLVGQGDADDLYGSAGDDMLKGGAGDDRGYGGKGKDVIHGNGGKDTLDGGNGADELNGGTQADLLFDGSGADKLTGGNGADEFWMSRDRQDDVIQDFEDGKDLIALPGWSGAASFDDLKFNDVTPGKVRVKYADEVLIVKDGGEGKLTSADFDRDDFVFYF